MSMPSTTGGQHNFAQIPSASIQRSTFDRSCGHKTTFDFGDLIPIFCDEALPGDTMSMKATTFGRLSTPLFPTMDNMYLDYFFFAVPIRLVWENWHKFNGAQDDPGDSTEFTVPQVTNAAALNESSLGSYFGLPIGKTNMTYCAFWHRAYALIWNEWFRDENLQDSAIFSKADASQVSTAYPVLKRGKRHDYFTSCLPWPQKGDPVTLPLGTVAPVVAEGTGQPTFDLSGETRSLASQAGQANTVWTSSVTAGATATWEDTALEADLTNATAATINELRQAFQVQRLYERDARGGTRLTEVIRAHFGVISPDARLQRPEFLGGGTGRVGVQQVAQTAEGGSAEVGKLAGFGTHSANVGFHKSFTEHCVILGLVSARADLNYQQGIPRMFSRTTRWDFYWPALAHLGEQAVLNQEIYFDDNPGEGAAQDQGTFGYQERYAEYRYKPSIVSGKFRSDASGSLDAWHCAQDFSALPVLGASFIEEDPPIDRIVAVPTEPHMILDCYFQYKCARPMPTFSVPGLIDHF